MEKAIAAAVVGLLALGAGGSSEIERGATSGSQAGADHRLRPMPFLHQHIPPRNLLLNAFGSGQPGPEEVRIPIPTPDGMYEVIVTKPGLARSVPVARDGQENAR